jgi:hypothetical protein
MRLRMQSIQCVWSPHIVHTRPSGRFLHCTCSDALQTSLHFLSTIGLLCALVLMHATSIKILPSVFIFYWCLHSQVVSGMHFKFKFLSPGVWVCDRLPASGRSEETYFGAIGAKKECSTCDRVRAAPRYRDGVVGPGYVTGKLKFFFGLWRAALVTL